MVNYAKKVMLLTVLLVLLLASQAISTVIYVSPDGDDSSGLSWIQAKKTVGGAIEIASSGDEIWVAASTYYEHIVMKAGVSIYGGFAGNETYWNQRNWETNKSVLDGNGNGRVITIPSEAGQSTVICGFTIQNGLEDNGGGIYCAPGSSPLIANSIITNNSASDATAYKPSGGGIYCDANASPTIRNNKIIGNTAFRGGGIFTGGYSQAMIFNNLFVNNSVENHGGGIYCDDESTATITNNTFVGNEGVNGGGIFCDNKSAPKITNNIITFGNTGIFIEWNATPTIKSNCVYGNTTYNYNGTNSGTNDVVADPLFVNAAAGDYHLLPGSPCIDKGDNLAVGTNWVDLDRDIRIQGAAVDIGAFEVDADLPPQVVSLSPTSGAFAVGTKYMFTTKYADPNGATDISGCYFLINTTLTGKNAVYVCYSEKFNTLYLRDDTNNGWFGGVKPGSSSVIQNSQCKVYCAGTTVVRSGNDITINWQIEFKSSMANKAPKAWLMVTDDQGLRDGWDQKGSYTIGTPPQNVSLDPTTATFTTGDKYTITTVSSDSSGFAKINGMYLLINSAVNGANAVYVCYSEGLNKLYLRNDANTSWGIGYTPGSSAVLENSQGKVYCQETDVDKFGDFITVYWRVQFKSALNGKTWKAFMLTIDDIGLRDGWDQMGTYSFN